MADLERRVREVAGARAMQAQPLVAVLAHAEPAEVVVFHDVAGDLRRPVQAMFDELRDADLLEELGARRWQGLVRVMLRWASRVATRDTSYFVAAVDGLPEPPPESADELSRWVLKHGVRRRLSDPAAAAAPLAVDFRTRQDLSFAGPSATIEDALERRVGGGRAPVVGAARSYLSWAAGRLAKRRGREELWALRPSSDAVAAAARRVRALLDELLAEGAGEAIVPVDEATMGLSEDGFVYAVRFRTPYGGDARARVHLLEARGERAACSADDERAVRYPEHVRLCAERALDLLQDEDHELHAEVRQALERPRWTHLLAELEQRVRPEDEPQPFEEGERLVWRVHQDELGVHVEAALQKQRKRGGWTKGRRVDVHGLAQQPGPLDPRDERVVTAWTRRSHHGMHPTSVGRVLEALVGHPRVVWADKPSLPLRVRRVGLEVRCEDRGGESWLSFRAGERELEPWELLKHHLGPAHVAWVDEAAAEVTVAPVPPPVRALAEACAHWVTGLPPEADDALLALLSRLPPSVGLELPRRLRGERREPDLRPVLQLEPLPGRGLRAVVTARPLAAGPSHPPGEGPTHLVGQVDGRRVYVVRDLAAERRSAERAISALGLDSGVADGPRAYRLDEPEDALDLIAALAAQPDVARAEWPEDMAPWRVVGGASLSNLKVRGRKLSEWFELRGEADLDEGKVTLAQIMAALRSGRRYVELGKGRYARIERELRAQLEAAQDVVFADGASLGVSGASLGFLEEILPEQVLEADVEWRAVRDRLRASGDLRPIPPPELRATLREYQREGIAWLLRVASWAPGACLADDMGLGKTLQALALALARSEQGPALVVCPTSVSDNWRRETERFAPSLSPHAYRGPDRAGLLPSLRAGDLVVTSYDIMLRDAEALAAIEWSTLIFDEAHALKNAQAQRTKAARTLPAGFRLGLTGTPLENHLGELWSLMSILVPGLLGPWKHFRGRFAAPIERDDDPERRAALRSLLRPFLLRRTKAQVAPELPPRVEVVRAVELSEDERALYEAERRAALRQLAEQSADPKKRFAVLAALMRLRRLACHPALVHPDSRVPSSKLSELLELVEDLRAEGHRALVFSQFTSHLALVRRALSERHVGTLYLDGSTPAAKRSELVDRWQSGEAELFLISLKAGGTGLNLTAADTVIHLDPWWNPAAEDQASDRTHRIGQDKPVTVVRLVCQDTIEETVMTLHEQKRELARDILDGAESNARLSTEDLLALLG